MKSLVSGIVLLISFFLVNNAYCQSIDELTAKIESNPSAELYLQRAQLYDQKDLFEKSNADFKKVIEMYKSSEDQDRETVLKAYTALADDIAYRQGEPAASLRYVVQGLDLDPDYEPLLLIKADAMYKLGQNEKSFDIYEVLTEKNPGDIDLWMDYAEKLENRDVKSAEKVYQKILALDASNTKALYFLGKYYTDISDKLNKAGEHPNEVLPVMEKGVDYLARYIIEKPEDQSVREALINFYEIMGEDKKARQLKDQ